MMLGNGVDLPKLASFTTDKEAYWSTSFQYPRYVEMESALARESVRSRHPIAEHDYTLALCP